MGEVYIGRSAALSFLQFLRATLKQYAGPSAFTESQTRHMMLEESVVGTDASGFSDELDYHAKASLIKCFLQEVSSLCPSPDDALGAWYKCVAHAELGI